MGGAVLFEALRPFAEIVSEDGAPGRTDSSIGD